MTQEVHQFSLHHLNPSSFRTHIKKILSSSYRKLFLEWHSSIYKCEKTKSMPNLRRKRLDDFIKKYKHSKMKKKTTTTTTLFYSWRIFTTKTYKSNIRSERFMHQFFASKINAFEEKLGNRKFAFASLFYYILCVDISVIKPWIKMIPVKWHDIISLVKWYHITSRVWIVQSNRL